MRAEDVDIIVKHTTTYDFSSLYEFWRTRKATLESRNTAVLKDKAQKVLNQNQNAAHNTQATATNSAINLLEQACNNVGGGKVDQPSPPSVEKAHERFLLALMSSISAALCREKGYLPLGRRTLIAPKQSQRCDEMAGTGSSKAQADLLTLDADYTGSKVLVIKATLSETEDLMQFPAANARSTPTREIGKGAILLLAPGALFARYIGLLPWLTTSRQNNEIPGAILMANAGKPALVSWMRRSLDWLDTKGLDISRLKAEPWLLVEVNMGSPLSGTPDRSQEGPAHPVIVPWPSSLCFQRQAKPIIEKQDQMPLMDAADMVDFVQTWLMTEDERVQTIQKRKQEWEAKKAASKAQAQGDHDLQDLSHMTSPLALRRSSLAGMVYPTPPDGVHIGPGATPTFDGSTSTPGPPMPHPMDGIEQPLPKPDLDENEHMEAFPNQGEGAGFSDSNNNLFDDMGDDDLFGADNGVTDADFSFFDEPDADGGDQMDFGNALGDGGDHEEHAMSLRGGNMRASPLRITGNKTTVDHDITMSNTDDTLANEKIHGEEKQIVADSVVYDGTNSFNTSATTAESSPPLKPDAVFRRLSSIGMEFVTESKENQGIRKPQPCISSLVELDLTPTMPTFQQKYGPNGRFIYPTALPSPLSMPTGIPTTDYFKRRRQRRPKASTNSPTFAPALSKHYGDHPDENVIVLEKAAGSTGTPSSLSEVESSSDDEDMPHRSNTNGKRKREIEDERNAESEEDFMSASLSELNMRGGELSSADGKLAAFDVTKLDGDAAGWSLANYLAWPDSWSNSPILKDTDFVAAARVLTDQAMSRNFEYLKRKPSASRGMDLETRAQEIYSNRYIQQDVLDATRQFFKDAGSCTLTSFLNIRGLKPPMPVRVPPRPNQSSSTNQPPASLSSPVFEIPPPHLEVRRSDSKLAVLPSAIDFWDILGLAPRSQSKDVTAICLYSADISSEGGVSLFMENMRSAYESRRFGCHERLEAEGVTNGTMAIDLDHPSRFSYDRGMSFVCEKLTDVLKSITSTKLRDRNFVLYFVYETEDPSALVGICGAFELLLSRYRLAMINRGHTNEVILQLVPRTLVGSRNKATIPSPNDVAKLAMEVYDRCYNFELGWPSPSMSIEPPLPRQVEFKLTPAPSSCLLQENSCMHIAYAQSIDDRWVSVAWTDNCGNEQFTASYCLARKGDALSRSFQEIAHEIWETTLDIISLKKVHWRLMIVKCGRIEPYDTQFWCDLVKTESKAQITLTILTVDTAPSLQLIPPEIELPATGMATHLAFSTTPVSTPQGNSILSPDSGLVSTPVAESAAAAEVKIEPDATLLELADQTYGAILSHELNDRNCLLDFRPTMLSGYVIKRAEHAPRAMEVNIIWTETNKNLLDRSLKEILTVYGNLATLARARGVVDPEGDPRPWHVVVAERICRAMYVLM